MTEAISAPGIGLISGAPVAAACDSTAPPAAMAAGGAPDQQQQQQQVGAAAGLLPDAAAGVRPPGHRKTRRGKRNRGKGKKKLAEEAAMLSESASELTSSIDSMVALGGFPDGSAMAAAAAAAMMGGAGGSLGGLMAGQDTLDTQRFQQLRAVLLQHNLKQAAFNFGPLGSDPQQQQAAAAAAAAAAAGARGTPRGMPPPRHAIPMHLPDPDQEQQLLEAACHARLIHLPAVPTPAGPGMQLDQSKQQQQQLQHLQRQQQAATAMQQQQQQQRLAVLGYGPSMQQATYVAGPAGMSPGGMQQASGHVVREMSAPAQAAAALIHMRATQGPQDAALLQQQAQMLLLQHQQAAARHQQQQQQQQQHQQQQMVLAAAGPAHNSAPVPRLEGGVLEGGSGLLPCVMHQGDGLTADIMTLSAPLPDNRPLLASTPAPMAAAAAAASLATSMPAATSAGGANAWLLSADESGGSFTSDLTLLQQLEVLKLGTSLSSGVSGGGLGSAASLTTANTGSTGTWQHPSGPSSSYLSTLSVSSAGAGFSSSSYTPSGPLGGGGPPSGSFSSNPGGTLVGGAAGGMPGGPFASPHAASQLAALQQQHQQQQQAVYAGGGALGWGARAGPSAEEVASALPTIGGPPSSAGPSSLLAAHLAAGGSPLLQLQGGVDTVAWQQGGPGVTPEQLVWPDAWVAPPGGQPGQQQWTM